MTWNYCGLFFSMPPCPDIGTIIAMMMTSIDLAVPSASHEWTHSPHLSPIGLVHSYHCTGFHMWKPKYRDIKKFPHSDRACNSQGCGLDRGRGDLLPYGRNIWALLGIVAQWYLERTIFFLTWYQWKNIAGMCGCTLGFYFKMCTESPGWCVSLLDASKNLEK